jgi:hypothetical protein
MYKKYDPVTETSGNVIYARYFYFPFLLLLLLALSATRWRYIAGVTDRVVESTPNKQINILLYGLFVFFYNLFIHTFTPSYRC